MILRFSDKGSPYVELDEHNRFIFSRLTANERGIKYLLYTNTPLNNDKLTVRARDNWFTTMFFKNPTNGKVNGTAGTNLGIPHSFKSNVFWKNGTVSLLRKMIGKHLLPTGEFPETAFPALAEDIVKYNRLADGDKKKLAQLIKDEEKKEGEKPGKKSTQKQKKEKREKPKKERKQKPERKEKQEKPKKEKKAKKIVKKKTRKVKAKAKPKKKTKKVVKKTKKTKKAKKPSNKNTKRGKHKQAKSKKIKAKKKSKKR